MALKYQRLYVNIDHVATVRQARRGTTPDPVAAAVLCEKAGADGITAHLREDRRHIQDEDITRLAEAVTTLLNLECAITDDMLRIAETLRPAQVTLVPERREEITTEGGLDVVRHEAAGPAREPSGRRGGVRSRRVSAAAETSRHRHAGLVGGGQVDGAAATLAASLGLAVHAGHGLSVENVGPVAAIPEIEELNIGHAIVGRAIFVGLDAAVREVRAAMDEAREADLF